MLPTKHRIKKPRVFHVKHPGKRRERGGKAVLVFFSASGGYRSCLFGNSNGKQNLLIGLLAATLSGYSGGVHNGQPPLDGVEKQPHILCAVKGKGTAAFGRAGQALDIFFRPGYGELMTNHMGGGLPLKLWTFQAKQGPGVPLRQACGAQTVQYIRCLLYTSRCV